MPRRSPFKRLLANPNLEFEFFLATELGMTVGRLRQEMTNAEFIHWIAYYERKSQREELEMKKAQAKRK